MTARHKFEPRIIHKVSLVQLQPTFQGQTGGCRPRAPPTNRHSNTHTNRERDEACGGRYAPAHTKNWCSLVCFFFSQWPSYLLKLSYTGKRIRLPANGFVCRRTGQTGGCRARAPLPIDTQTPTQKERERRGLWRAIGASAYKKTLCDVPLPANGFVCRRTGSFAGERIRLPANGFAYRRPGSFAG